MKCPFCGKEYLSQDEIIGCIAKHTQEYQEQQVKESQRFFLMLMASQLTMASLMTHSSARDVVERFSEIYQLLDSLTQKPDVIGEIEKWLREKHGESKH